MSEEQLAKQDAGKLMTDEGYSPEEIAESLEGII